MSGTDKETDMKICENGVIRDMTPEEIAAMEEAGIKVAPSPAALGSTLLEVLGK